MSLRHCLVVIFFAFSPFCFAGNFCVENFYSVYHYFNDTISPERFDIDLSNCELQDSNLEKLLPIFASALINTEELINLKKNHFTDNGLSQILARIELLDKVQSVGLNLSDNRISSQGIKLLAQNHKVGKLGLENFKLSDEDAAILASSNALRKIYLKNTQLSSMAATLLASKNNLEEFSILSNPGIITPAVVKSLSKQQSLAKVSLDGVTFLLEDLQALLNLPKLTELWLRNGQLPKGGIELISQSKLDRLMLDNMQIGDREAAILANSTSLDYVFLPNNDIKVAGAKALATSVKIFFLDLSYNPIGSHGAMELVAGKNIRRLSLEGIGLTTNDAIALTKVANPKLSGIILSHNPIADEALPYLIATFFKRDYDLLFLNYTNITEKGLLKLKPTHRGGWLSLNGNHIGFEGAKALVKFYGKATSSLQLNDNDLDEKSLLELSKIHYAWIDLRHNHLTRKAIENFIQQRASSSINWREE